MWLPIPTAPNHTVKICPTCHIHHPVKSLHIGLGPDGDATISDGVLELLKKVGPAQGLPAMDGYTVESVVKDPPPLKLGKTTNRAQIDNENRATIMYSEPTTKGAISNG